ncbi:MAG TPA: hypothetical protein VLH85_05450 [Levilinea sp.]|nr:hypothetical protein [Levilinea sp.]
MPKCDGVIEAVRYDEDGRIDMVRVYERRGPTWSDLVLMKRDVLIERMRCGKKFYTGTRKAHLGGTFEVTAELRLAGKPGEEVIVTRSSKAECDRLDGAPVF